MIFWDAPKIPVFFQLTQILKKAGVFETLQLTFVSSYFVRALG